jgi:hypothetical protein
MRLREMLEIVNHEMPRLAFQQAAEGANVRLQSFSTVMSAIRALRQVPPLAETAQACLSTKLAEYQGANPLTSQEDAQSFRQSVNMLNQQAAMVLTALRAVVTLQDPLAISVQIPVLATNAIRPAHPVLEEPFVDSHDAAH